MKKEHSCKMVIKVDVKLSFWSAIKLRIAGMEVLKKLEEFGKKNKEVRK